MPDVISLGELLIDFCAGESDVSLAQARSFVKAPGGAPANVAVAVARLGRSAGFVGCVGADAFGQFLRQTLEHEGVDVEGLVHTKDAPTTLAFIASRSDGRKEIDFFSGADTRFSISDLRLDSIRSAGCFHHGSISLRTELGLRTTMAARDLAAGAGAMISYDPNWRPALWADQAQARQTLLAGFAGAHVVKVSQEEWSFVTGTEDFAGGAQFLMSMGPEMVVRSEGADGASFAVLGGRLLTGRVEPFKVTCVEPTGAGDAFMACLIVELLDHWRAGRRPGDLDEGELRRIIRRANATGALACTKVGAIPSMPTADEVDKFVHQSH